MHEAHGALRMTLSEIWALPQYGQIDTERPDEVVESCKIRMRDFECLLTNIYTYQKWVRKYLVGSTR